MASPFGHIIVAYAMGKTIRPEFRTSTFWGLTVACCLLPDVDVIGLLLGIPYEHVMGHRGFSHSLFFGVMVGGVVAWLAFPYFQFRSQSYGILVVYFSGVTVSHGMLDAMTNGGLGIAFFAPFDPTRYFFPWRPLTVPPIGILEFFSEWGLGVLVSELIWLGVPVCCWLIVLRIMRKR